MEHITSKCITLVDNKHYGYCGRHFCSTVPELPIKISEAELRGPKATSQVANTTFRVVRTAFVSSCKKLEMHKLKHQSDGSLFREYLACLFLFSVTGSSNSQRKQIPVVPFFSVQRHTRARHCPEAEAWPPTGNLTSDQKQGPQQTSL